MEIENTDVSRSKEMNSMGVSLSTVNKNQNAIKYFDKSIEADADFFEAQYNKIKVYIDTESFDEAMDCLNQIIEEDNRQSYAYFLKANILFFYNNKLNEAIELYNRAIFLGEKSENAYFNLGLCMYKSKENVQALKWIERAEKINGKRTDILLKKGEILTVLKRYEDAIKTYENILIQQADNYEAYHFKTLILAEEKKYSEALETLVEAEKIIGTNGLYEFDRAVIYESMLELEKALYHIDKSLEFNNKNTFALLKKGYLLTISKDYYRAKQIFNFILEIEPNNFASAFNKANVHMFLKEYKDAFVLYNFIIENSQDTNPFNVPSYYFKGLCLRNLGDIEEAQRAYQTANLFYSALSLKYSQDTNLMLLKANTLRDMQKYHEAEEIYAYILELNDNLVDVHLMRAKNYLYMNDIEKVKEELSRVLSINAAYAEVIKLDDEISGILN